MTNSHSARMLRRNFVFLLLTTGCKLATAAPLSKLKLLELISKVRLTYVKRLSSTVAKLDAYVEPALRNANGELAVEGSLGLPFRPDCIPRDSDGKSVMVDSIERVAFQPFKVSYGSCVVSFNPFVWDWIQISVSGIPRAELDGLLKRWFMRWFDPDDQNAVSSDGLYGVVHFLGEPKKTDGGFAFVVDFGSAPSEALDLLLEEVAGNGATWASVA